jgi:hypothetical protein
LADRPWADVAVSVRIRVRKFVCANSACPSTDFEDRWDGVAQTHALRTDRWAMHKGVTYGTILVDLERQRPVDLRPDRASGSLAAWLRALHANRAAVVQFARTVGISRMTVYRYLRDGPRKRHSVHRRQRVLEPWEPYLLERWPDGCRTPTVLW